MAATSREVLTLNQSESSISFGKNNGYFLSKKMVVILAGLFVTATVSTGLLVYYYAPNARGDTPFPGKDEQMISTTTIAAPKDDIDVRLPTSIKPLHYKIFLRPFMFSKNFEIEGNVQVEFEVLEETSNVTLHILDIITHNETIKVVPMDDLEGPGVGITEHVYDPLRQFYIAHLEEPLESGKMYMINMDFTGYLNDKLAGFYRSVYTDEEGKERLLASTQFEATDARRAFPCFDEPAMKATFKLTLARHENMSSIANMPLLSTTPMQDEEDWYLDEFNTTVPMSTYLVAFVISDFVYLNSTENDHVLFRVWAREGAIDQGKYALDKGPEVLLFYENYFDIPFPLPKQDMIAIPDFSAGAMENWGLVTYRETALLLDDKQASASNKQRVGVVISHELAHQWFGNLVTPKWWSDLWLNEGFASYMEYLGTDAIEPEWKMLDQFMSRLHGVLSLDCLDTSHPISVEVDNPDSINQLFDGISYDKGSSIIRMMNNFMTEQTFKAGIHNYLSALAYDNAAQDDLWRYLTEQAHTDGTLPSDFTIKDIMDSWTLQKGYPVISVTVNEADQTATLKQEKFVLVEPVNATTHNYKWWVPITYTGQDDLDFDTTKPSDWMSVDDTEMTISDMPSAGKWVIFNIQETGYYRVNYDDKNWNLLVNQLTTDHSIIHVKNRAQLLDDSLNLAKGGYLGYNLSLSIVSYLQQETEFVAWEAGFFNLGYLEEMFTTNAGYGPLKEFYMSMLVPLYNSVGFEDQLDDPLLEQYKRDLATSWVCKFEYEDCVTKSVNLFEGWKADPENNSIISPNLKTTVYCTSIREGGEEDWDFLWSQYLASNVGTEKSRILYALGCSKVPWILSKYLDMAFTEGSGIRSQDSSRVFSSVSRNDYGRDIAWRYLQEEWQKISNYFGSFTTLGDMVKIVTSEFNTHQQLHEIELFKEDHADSLGKATTAVDQAIEQTKNNIAWMENYRDVIVQWLAEHGYNK